MRSSGGSLAVIGPTGSGKSTIRDADKIMVIGDGRILESGNHAGLMAAKGAYYKMVVSQMGVLSDTATEGSGL